MLVTERLLQNESDCMKLYIEELEFLFGVEDSEVNLRPILRNAGRRGGRIFEICSSKKRVSTQFQAKCGGMSVRS